LNRGNHITALENRLKRMESVITSSGLSLDASGRERLSSDDIAGQAGMVDRFSSLKISAAGDEEFVGMSNPNLVNHKIRLTFDRRLLGLLDILPARTSTHH
jgi:hypothetical protein